jgi:hypothetical protein
MATASRSVKRSPAVLRCEARQEVKRKSLCCLCQASSQKGVRWGRGTRGVQACVQAGPVVRSHPLPPCITPSRTPHSHLRWRVQRREPDSLSVVLMGGEEGGGGGGRAARTRRSSLANACPGAPLAAAMQRCRTHSVRVARVAVLATAARATRRRRAEALVCCGAR